ncbi:hypothetical protein JAO78_007490 [Alishewanella sp. 16-MA]|uniref:Uncharacterized protein n=1 Tax=Alishewanella maricola TaxID=2795740 RepID=A0ABS8C2V7_9ALTE|nr:hypothetical protein [Alishewanella maricola]MCB5226659.1 hypothetical protein [Alishewanella maricola]
MSNSKRHQGFLAQYFIVKYGERGLSYAYGMRQEHGLPLHLIKTAPIVRFDRKTARFYTHYGVYAVGELITDPDEQQLYKLALAKNEVHFLDDFTLSVPLSLTLH